MLHPAHAIRWRLPEPTSSCSVSLGFELLNDYACPSSHLRPRGTGYEIPVPQPVTSPVGGTQPGQCLRVAPLTHKNLSVSQSRQKDREPLLGRPRGARSDQLTTRSYSFGKSTQVRRLIRDGGREIDSRLGQVAPHDPLAREIRSRLSNIRVSGQLSHRSIRTESLREHLVTTRIVRSEPRHAAP